MAATMSGDTVLGPDGRAIPNDERNAVVRFFLTASRGARRAALYTGRTIKTGAVKVGHGVTASLPYVGVTLMFALCAAFLVLAFYLNFLFIQFAFTINPAIGWVLIGFMVLQIVGMVVGGIVSVISYFS